MLTAHAHVALCFSSSCCRCCCFLPLVLPQRIADDLSGSANDSTKATDRLLWAVNAFGESLAEVSSVVPLLFSGS